MPSLKTPQKAEHPIICSIESVKAILKGRKTQTRRVIKFQPEPNHIEEFKQTWQGLCPYGQVGDRLIIKETWATEKRYDHLKPSLIPDTAKIYYIDKAIHKAGGYSLFTEMGKVRSAMFMCRWMSRLTPPITEVRVERVQDITPEDCILEGLQKADYLQDIWRVTALSDFRNLWDSLNAKRGYGWEVNPWGWVITFKKI